MLESLSIVAAGGGSAQNCQAELSHAVELVGKEHDTQVLVVPTGSTTPKNYSMRIEAAKEVFTDRLQLPLQVLHDFGSMPKYSELQEKFEAADLIFIPGGNTALAMREWASHGIDDLIKARALGGSVLSGISLGTLTPFKWGISDPFPGRRANSGEFTTAVALGLVPAAVTPHYNRKMPNGGVRGTEFDAMFASQSELPVPQTAYGFGIDNRASLVIHDGIVTMLTRDDTNSVVLLHQTEAGVERTQLTVADSIPLAQLVR